MDDVSVWAVLAAGLANFAIGGLWYGVLFTNPWKREVGVPDDAQPGSVVKELVYSVLLCLVMAVFLAPFIGNEGIGFGTFAGFASGAGFIAPTIAQNYVFEGKSPRLFAINAGYSVVAFTVMGAIIGAIQA